MHSFHSLSLFKVVDERWTKIDILRDLIGRKYKETEELTSEYLLWMDADAIIIDFEFKLSDLIISHPDADILASADIRQGFINTGQ